MNKTGLVLKIEKKAAIIATSTGEFVKVSVSSNPPKIGEVYTGAEKTRMNYTKYLKVAVLLFLILIFSGSTYLYYTPVAAIEVNINPSLELKTNCFDRIIKALPLNADGKTLLKNMDLKNKNIDEGLTMVIQQAKKDNFINSNYIEQGKTVSIKISSNNTNKSIKLDKFQKCITQNKINTNIYNNQKVTKHEFIKKQSPLNDTNNTTNVGKGNININKKTNPSIPSNNVNVNPNPNAANKNSNPIIKSAPNSTNSDGNKNESKPIKNDNKNKIENKTINLPGKKK